MKYFCSFIFLVLISLQGAEPLAIAPELHDDLLDRLPLMHREDAKAFYRVIKPLTQTPVDAAGKNPYELYLQATVFGKIFGEELGALNAREAGLKALALIATNYEIKGSKKFLLSSLRIDDITPGISARFSGGLVRDISVFRTDFETQFGESLRRLATTHNVFAYWILGLMDYEKSLVDNFYLHRAADGFCEPALRSLKTIYSQSRKKTSLIDDKVRHLEELKTPQNLLAPACLSYALENNIFATKLTTTSCCSFSCSKTRKIHPDKVQHAMTTSYPTKLIESILIHENQQNQKFYENVRDYLQPKVSDTRRGASLTVASKTWITAQIVMPAVALAGNAFLLYMTTHLDPSKDIIADNTRATPYNLLRYGALVPTLSVFASWGLNIYSYCKRPKFVVMNETDVEDTVGLVSILCAVFHQLTDTPKAMGDHVYNQWFTHRTRTDLGKSALESLGR